MERIPGAEYSGSTDVGPSLFGHETELTGRKLRIVSGLSGDTDFGKFETCEPS